MHALIVNAHPERRSFNGALSEVAANTLQDLGHKVEVSDLYEMGFKAIADTDDFGVDRDDKDYFRVDREQTFAQEHGTLAADIDIEQQKIARADLVILQFPMWWFGMPAILKGWADRVFTRGFAYAAGRKYDTGMLRGKRALVSLTTGTSEDTYAPDGIDGAILDVLWPVHNGLLRYVGFDVLEPFVTYAPRQQSKEERTEVLAEYARQLSSIDARAALFSTLKATTVPTRGSSPEWLPGLGSSTRSPANSLQSDEREIRGASCWRPGPAVGKTTRE